MFITTRGRYALRVLIDLAEHRSEGYVAMREVAERQDISLKYLEKILPSLVDAGLIEGVHGKGGGYRLVKDPSEYRVGEVLRITEDTISPVACLAPNAETCERTSYCKTLPLWKGLEKVVSDYLDSVSLSDLAGPDQEAEEGTGPSGR